VNGNLDDESGRQGMNTKVFVATWALGYDYLLFTSMLGVVLIAVAFAFIARRVANRRHLRDAP
jgi:hypothetical protein